MTTVTGAVNGWRLRIDRSGHLNRCVRNRARWLRFDAEVAVILTRLCRRRGRGDTAAGRARLDFTASSGQLPSNFNAPSAIVDAAALYVFRTLAADDIPLNAGCLAPLELRVRPDSLLDPAPQAAVVAGNVETSQHVVDALYGAMGVMADS